MQSVLRTLLKKQNKNKAHTHAHFTILQEHGNILNTIPQVIALLNTKRKKNQVNVFEKNLHHFKWFLEIKLLVEALNSDEVV